MTTLAETLGETWHLSPLKRKLKRLGLQEVHHWIQLSVQRGCAHYQSNAEQVRDPGEQKVSNMELAVSLLLGETPYDPRAIRIAGALLSDCRDPEDLVDLGRRERVLPRIRYIAEQGAQVEPDNPLWRDVMDRTRCHRYREGLLPHRDRFTVPAGTPREMLHGATRNCWVGLKDL